MILPSPADLLPAMARELKAHLARHDIAAARFIGIRTGGVWVAQALLAELGRQEELGTLDVSFYRDDFTRSGLHPQVRPSELPFEIDGQHLVLIDDEPFTVKREDVLSKVGWSPFEGRTFRSRIGATWVNGRMVWNGQHLVGTPNGQRLEFAR